PGPTTGPESSTEPGPTTGPESSNEPGPTTGPESSTEPGPTTGPESSTEPGPTTGSQNFGLDLMSPHFLSQILRGHLTTRRRLTMNQCHNCQTYRIQCQNKQSRFPEKNKKHCFNHIIQFRKYFKNFR
uniref:Uncharacterized protein n=1 Tax=Esox lucius TaxID=8010 RepID=A0AAY5KB95_ESOLU